MRSLTLSLLLFSMTSLSFAGILDDVSTGKAVESRLLPKKDLVYLQLKDFSDPFNLFQEGFENDDKLDVSNKGGVLEVSFAGFSYSHNSQDSTGKETIVALAYDAKIQRYLITSSTLKGKVNYQLIINVDRKSGKGRIHMRESIRGKMTAFGQVANYQMF